MRKYYRYALRHQAEKNHLKPSRYVAFGWDQFQEHRYGWINRQRNIAHGTHPKNRWPRRVQAVLG